MWNSGWDKLFDSKEWGKYPPEELIRFIARNFYKKKDRSLIKILEIGCGTGANIWFLSREGFSAYGIDGSIIAISKAKERLNNENLKYNLVKADATNIPYKNDFFDAVIDIECVYANNLESTKKIINEVYRVLKNNGYFFSKTFMTGMSGSETGTRLNGEKNTFLEMKDSPLHNQYGLIRLTSEEEISKIYGKFQKVNWDYTYRTDNNMKDKIGEWLITCSKFK